MLSRRHLRKRSLQALYAYYQSEQKDLAATEKQLFHGIERTTDLLYALLEAIPELGRIEHNQIAEAGNKFLEKSRLRHVRTLEGNFLANLLANDPPFRKIIKTRKISWQNDHDTLRRIFTAIRKSDEYRQYVLNSGDREDDLAFCISLFRTHLVKSESFQQFIEENNIYWADGFPFASEMALKILKSVNATTGYALEVPAIYRDETDDRRFLKIMISETVRNDTYFESLIREKARNWELERIALIDVILMKMALTEILEMENIPVKVSINEYLEIAKEFSTPKSRLFINGIIDKLVLDLRGEKKIVKTGRGLVE